jgi:uncharacterized membrane protein
MRLNFRRNFLTGLLVLVPAVVAAWVLYNAFMWVDTLLWDRVRFSFVRKGGIPGVGFVIVILVVFLTGILTNNYIGGRLIRGWERVLLRIPLFNKIYSAAKHVSEAFLSPERKNVFRSVGLVEFPRDRAFAIAFEVSPASEPVRRALAARGEGDWAAVFVPSTPNPTTGFLIIVARPEYRLMSVSIEDGLKMVISGGVFMPPEQIAAGRPGAVEVQVGELRGA